MPVGEWGLVGLSPDEAAMVVPIQFIGLQSCLGLVYESNN